MSLKKRNKNLRNARVNRYDEFFTRFEDIDKELSYYTDHFKDKVIYCNTDNPDSSEFANYFLVAHYKINWDTVLFSWLKPDGSGSFDSKESIDKLKQCDTVVTNPPFSKIKQFLRLLTKYEKKFLIIINPNVVTYKEVFPLIRDNKMWLGVKNMGTDMLFNVTEEHAKELLNRSKTSYRIVEGKVLGRTAAVWLTNLDHPKRHKWLELTKVYNPGYYQRFDNYSDAINVDKVSDIPKDYEGVMGVPITFLNHYNPDQFKIIGIAAHAHYDPEMTGIPLTEGKDGRPKVNGKIKFARIFIQKKVNMIQFDKGSIKTVISHYFNLNPDNKDDKDLIHRIYSYIGKGVEWTKNDTNETFYLQGLAKYGDVFVIIYNKSREYHIKDSNNFMMEWKEFNRKFTPKELSWLNESWLTKKCDKY